MKKLSNKKINKTFRDNLITYGMVIAAYVIMQILVSAGSVSSLIQGLLVPLCTYAILALAVAIISDISIIQCPCSFRYTFSSSSFFRSSENHSSLTARSRKKVDFPAP